MRHDVSQLPVWEDCPFKDRIAGLDTHTDQSVARGILKYGHPDYWDLPIVVKRDETRIFFCLEEPPGGWKFDYTEHPGHLYVDDHLSDDPGDGPMRSAIRILRLQTHGEAFMRGKKPA